MADVEQVLAVIREVYPAHPGAHCPSGGGVAASRKQTETASRAAEISGQTQCRLNHGLCRRRQPRGTVQRRGAAMPSFQYRRIWLRAGRHSRRTVGDR